MLVFITGPRDFTGPAARKIPMTSDQIWGFFGGDDLNQFLILPEDEFSWLVVWNMNFMFPYIGNVIIPTDELIFFRGFETTNQ